MIWIIIKKQALIFWRNPHQIFLLIALPIILISILSISLGSFGTESGSVKLEDKIAIIEHSDERKQVTEFIETLSNRSLPEDVQTEIRKSAEQLRPIERLKEDVFGEMKENFQVDVLKPTEKKSALNNDSYAAIIEIPENFTYHFLERIFFAEEIPQTIQLFENEGREIAFNVVKSVVHQYEEQLTLFIYANKNNLSIQSLLIDQDTITGEVSAIEQSKTIKSTQYYTVGMAVMNVLFIAATIGSFAFNEKKDRVFNRIILSDLSRWVYFIGVFISSTIFAFLQLLIIFTVSWVLFGVAWDNLIGFLIITATLALSVGGIGVLLTTISFRLDSELVTNTFQSIVISIFAFVGGSFFPIGELSNAIQTIGYYTPNGASMTAYLNLLRGNELVNVYHHLVFQIIFAALLIVIAVISFPKRGES